MNFSSLLFLELESSILLLNSQSPVLIDCHFYSNFLPWDLKLGYTNERFAREGIDI